jgi:hypothetical protein
MFYGSWKSCVVALLVATGIAGCGGSNNPAPSCDLLTCSGHGACSLASGSPACVCTAGYGGAICATCVAGYHDASGACVADGSCALANPCGAHGTCQDAGGIVTCICAAGWTGATCDACAVGHGGPDCASCLAGFHDAGGGVCLLAGETCEMATPVSGTLTGQTTVGYTNDYLGGPTCTPYNNTAPDRVYSALVPAGQVLTVTATPTTSWDLAVYLIPGALACATPQTCAGADAKGVGVAETAVYRNRTADGLTVAIVVDSASSVPAEMAGDFTLEVTVAPPPPGETCQSAAVVGPGSYSGTTAGPTWSMRSWCRAGSCSPLKWPPCPPGIRASP